MNRLLLLVLAFVVSHPETAMAASLAEAAALRDTGRAREAYEQMYILFLQTPDDPDVNFQLGLAARDSDELENAVMAFERVLMARPDAHRARLEMALCFERLGDAASARREYAAVLEREPPEPVADTIRRRMAAMDAARKRHFFSAHGALNLLADDNVNISPGAETIIIDSALGDLPVITAGSEADTLLAAELGAAYTWRPPGQSWAPRIEALTYCTKYDDENQLDVILAALTGGLLVDAGPARIDLAVFERILDLGRHRYMDATGVSVGTHLSMTPRLQMSLGATAVHKDFARIPEKDADTITASLVPRLFAPRQSLTLTLLWEKENARNESYTYHRSELSCRHDLALPGKASLFLAYSYTPTRYREPLPLFTERRSDRVRQASAGLAHPVWQSASGWEVHAALSYTRTRADSSLEIYRYDKNVVSAGISAAF